jgi:heptosyltransferase-1
VTRVLIVRLGALGDIVHAIPAAAALRRAFPAARIDWLVAAKHRALLDLVPVIDRRLAVDGRATFLDTIRELRRAAYDVTLDLQGLLKSAVLARASGARRVIGFGARTAREPLARLFYTDAHDCAAAALRRPGDAGSRGFAAHGPSVHVIHQYLSLLEPLGVTVSRPEFPIDDVESPVAAQVAAEHGDRYALLNGGAAWPNKRWPAVRFGALAAGLRERHDLRSVVLWGPGEERLAQDIVAASFGAAAQSPPTTIGDLVALARGAALMVSGDTGPTHIAAAVGTPIVGIYGPTWPARNGPWSPQDVVVSRDEVCQCLNLRRCRLKSMCLLDVGVDEVLTACGARLAGAR